MYAVHTGSKFYYLYKCLTFIIYNLFGPSLLRPYLDNCLQHAFASTPLFEPFVIPLLLDKLSSSLLLAKVGMLNYSSIHHKFPQYLLTLFYSKSIVQLQKVIPTSMRTA